MKYWILFAIVFVGALTWYLPPYQLAAPGDSLIGSICLIIALINLGLYIETWRKP